MRYLVAATRPLLAAGLLTVGLAHNGHAAPEQAPQDIVYKTTDSGPLGLSLHRPSRPACGLRPLVVWLHGGAWSRGSRHELPSSNPNLHAALLNAGFAVASVGYRLSGEAVFPAPVRDIHDALNFLHKQGPELGLDSRQIVVAGRSSGGHLAALVGLINSHETPAFLDEPRYRISGIVSFFGLSDLTLESSRQMAAERAARSPTARFLGAPPAAAPELAKQASPLSYVTARSAPTLLLHGRKDRQVPLAHSEALQQALAARGVAVALRIEDEAAHSDRVFDSDAHVPAVLNFIQ